MYVLPHKQECRLRVESEDRGEDQERDGHERHYRGVEADPAARLHGAGAGLGCGSPAGFALAALLTGKIDALAVAYGNGQAFISANKDKIDFSGFEFVVDDLYKNNVILLNKNNAALGEEVNKVLAKAKATNVYTPWYEACEMLAEIKTVDELGYDDDGNKISE